MKKNKMNKKYLHLNGVQSLTLSQFKIPEFSKAKHHNEFYYFINKVYCISFLNFLQTKSDISKISTK